MDAGGSKALPATPQSRGSRRPVVVARPSLLHRLLRPRRRVAPPPGRFLEESVDDDEDEDEDDGDHSTASNPRPVRRGKRIRLQRFVPAQELVAEADAALYIELADPTDDDDDAFPATSSELEPYEDAELKRLKRQREAASRREGAIEAAHTAVQLTAVLLREAGCNVVVYPLQERDSDQVAHTREDTSAYVLTVAAGINDESHHRRVKVTPLAEWVWRHPAFHQRVLPLQGAAQSQQLVRLILTEFRVERDLCLTSGLRVLRGGQKLIDQLGERDDMCVQIVPLHRDDARRKLVAKWRAHPTLALPLRDVYAYFGPKLGMYFAWLTFYTKMLLLPSACGLVAFVLAQLNVQSYGVYSFGLAIGTSVFVDMWRRRQRELEYLWKYQTNDRNVPVTATIDIPTPESDACAFPPCAPSVEYIETRPEFRGEWMRDPVTQQEIFDFPHHKRLFRQLLALPLLLSMCCVVGAYVVGLNMLSDMLRATYGACYAKPATRSTALVALNDALDLTPTMCSVISHGPGMLNALIIYLMDLLYQLLARKLNDFENYRTDAEYEDHLVMKRMPFHFVNSNASLWFLAFYVQSLERVRDRLWILLVATQVLDNLKEVALPYVVSVAGQLRSYTVAADSRQRRRHRTDSYDDRSGSDSHDKGLRRRKSVSETAVQDRIARVLLQRRQAQYGDTFADYKELMVQYGYVALYSPIFPLAPAFALINNVIESRSDFLKLVNRRGYQRPRVQHSQGIGVWEKVLVSSSVVAVVVNCALVWTYELHELLPAWSELHRFMFIVVRSVSFV